MRSKLTFLPLFSISVLLLSVSSGWAAGQVEDFRVGLILDSGSTLGRIILTSVNMSLFDFYNKHPNSKRRLQITLRNSDNDVVNAASAAIDLIQNEKVQAIVGPQSSMEAVFLADLATRSHVPVVSFTATSPSVSPKEKQYFVRAAPSDGAQSTPIADFVRAFGWKRVVLVYEDTIYGSGAIPNLFDGLKEVEVRVPYRAAVTPSASDDRILKELYKLKTMQTRVFIVHLGTSLASRFFPLAREAGMMSEGFVWIITQGLAELLDTVDPAVLESMVGVIAVRPYVAGSKDLEEFKKRWRRNFWLENPESGVSEPTTVGIRAYDTIWALAMAAETAGNSTARYAVNEDTDNSSDMATLGTSISGPEILKAILETTFDGLSGKFRLIDVETPPKYELVNIIGKSQRTLGFWPPSFDWYGHRNIHSIVWPGDSTVVPRGWEHPVGEAKIRIGIPTLSGFNEVLKIDNDTSTNATIPSGFVIDVFEEAVKRLPYAVPFEYVPFDGDYDDLVHQIALNRFDAAVGDITITYDRSEEVDFTLPYTERGVAMVVPVKDQREGQGWLFLQPLEPALWVVAWASFVFTAGVLWVLEHQENRYFRGSLGSQIGFVLYFTFSTLVFAHREKVKKNLSRVVLIVWLFVVLVLTSSYTANLASLFTVRRIEPTYNSINELKRNGEYVGYPEKSFILKVLKDFGFQESQLKSYRSAEEYETALAIGSANGGVSAIVNELPYLRVFLKDRCSKFAITNLIYNSEGFGFAFPRGSPLAIGLSRSILQMTGGNRILEIETRRFGEYKSCPDRESDISQNTLDFYSFWVLFLITGLASVIPLFGVFVSFLHQKWQKVNREKAGISIQQKFLLVFKNLTRKISARELPQKAVEMKKAIQTSQSVQLTRRRLPLNAHLVGNRRHSFKV